jgi:phospholipid transport system substrate-binding protein
MPVRKFSSVRMIFAVVSIGPTLLGLAAPVAAQVVAAPANAGNPAARAFVERLSADAFAVLRDPSLSKPAARTRFRAMLEQNVALEDIGGRLIRRHRAAITPAQYVSYQKALPEFVLNAYSDRLYNYADATVKTLRTVGRGPAITDVHTRVTRPGGQPIDAVWQVKTTPAGKQVINNLSVAGINLSLTQEADFNAYIQKNGFDALVAFLKSANTKSATARATA